MKNILKLFILIIFISSCSFNTNSSLWTKKKEIKKDNILNTKQIIKKQKILENELNNTLKINLSNFVKWRLGLKERLVIQHAKKAALSYESLQLPTHTGTS